MRLLMVDISSGRLGEGDALPREADLAQEFGVSRGVIREALRGLEERGLVRVKHGRGTTVTASRLWNVLDPDVLEVLLQSRERTGILAEFLAVRRLLEIEAAGLAAERANDSDLLRLSETLARTRTAAERAVVNRAAEHLFHEADIDFHRAVMAASGNRVLSQLTEPIQRALLATRTPLVQRTVSIEHGIPEHAEIVTAIAKHDPVSAREAMSKHLLTVEAILRADAEHHAADEIGAERMDR